MHKFYSLLALLAAAISFTCCTDDEDNGAYEGGRNDNKNTVKLEFSNNPYWNGTGTPGKGETPEDTVWVFTYEVQNTKVDGSKGILLCWSCYQMHTGYTGSYNRVTDGKYYNDTENLDPGDYYSTDYIRGSGYEHGHVCPNADRKYSYMANYQTFYMTNMQPQYHKFNGYTNSGSDRGEGLWVRMENQVRSWTPREPTDTLYVCKGGTIDNEEQIIERLRGRLIVPKYFFMACLVKNSMGYRAIGFWVEQKSTDWRDDEPLSAYTVTIDKLEELTGIDFFCNLPDDIENSVESTVALKAWGLINS